jgi:hypothetical protein
MIATFLVPTEAVNFTSQTAMLAMFSSMETATMLQNY